MDTYEQIYDALSEALGTENDNHDGPVTAIHTLMRQRDDALLLVKRFRARAQEEIDGGGVQPVVKFNGGNPVVLCHLCRAIAEYGVDPRTTKARICPAGHGCGTNIG